MNKRQFVESKDDFSYRDTVTEIIQAGVLSGYFALGLPLKRQKLKEYVDKRFPSKGSGQPTKTPESLTMAIREALVILRERRLVSIVPKQGTYPRLLSEDEILEIQETRRVLEQFVARHLAQMADVDLTELTRLNRTMRRLADAHPRSDDDLIKFVTLDDQFHRGLAELAGFGTTIAPILGDLRSRLRLVALPSAKSFRGTTVDEHENILKAIRKASQRDRTDLSEVDQAVENHLTKALDRWKWRVGRNVPDSAD